MLTRRLAAALTAVALAAVACGGDEDATSPPVASPTATETESPEPTVAPTPSAEAVDVAAVPDEITVEYVQAVMDEINATEYAMLIDARDRGEMGEEFLASMASIWDAAHATSVADSYRQAVTPEGIREDASPLTTTVLEIREATEDCIEFRGERDLSLVLTPEVYPVEATETFVRLRAAEPTQLNPTMWRYAYSNREAPVDTCDA